jgi:hypothetical protein
MTPSYLGSAAVSKSYLGGAQASSIALGQGGGVLPPWTPTPGALVDADFVAGRYYYNGVTHQSQSDWLTAIGGMKTGNVIVFPWTDQDFIVICEARKAAPSVSEYLYSFDNDLGTNASVVVALHNSANSQIIQQVRASNTTLASTSLGPYSLGRTLKTVQSVKSQAFFAAINGIGGAFATPGSAALPAITKCRIGGGYASGQEWSGEIYRFTIIPTPLLTSEAAIGTAYSVPNWKALIEGDSYGDGSNNVGVISRLAVLSRQQIYPSAIGGSTITNVRDRILALSASVKALPTAIWDGDANGYSTAAAYLAIYDQAVQALGHSRFVVIPPTIRTPLTEPDKTAYRDITAGLKAAYPNNVVDAMPILIANGDPVADAADIAAGCVPTSLLQAGNVHLNDAGMNPVMAAVYAKMAPWMS